MLDFLKPYLLLIALLVLLAINLACFLGGVKLGGRWIQERWDAQKLADAKALSIAKDESLEKVRRYALQLESANGERDFALAALARVRADPVPSIVCYSTANTGGSVSGLSAPSVSSAPITGELPRGVEFDPTEQLKALADRADDQVETLRDLWNRWPH